MSGVENPSAFPNGLMGSLAESPGMTLRDHYAGLALQGWLSSWPNDGGWPVDSRETLARSCYEMADAMLAERAKAGAQ